jgi:transposase InsO family protein
MAVLSEKADILNIVDDVTKECLGAIADTSLSGRRVARELTSIVTRRGKPGSIVSDNGTEFTCWPGARTTPSTGTSLRRASQSRTPFAKASTANARRVLE